MVEVQREELLNSIEFELNSYSHEIQQNGWSRWIIAGAIIAALATILEALQSPEYKLLPALMVFVVLSLVGMPVVGIIMPARTVNESHLLQGRLTPAARQFYRPLLDLAVSVAWIALTIVGLWRFRTDIPGPLYWAVTLALVLGILTHLSIPVMSRLKTYVVFEPSPPLIAYLLAVPAYLLMPYTGVVLALSGELPLPPSIRAGCAPIAIIVSLLILANLDPYRYVRNQLISLRRDITLVPLTTEDGVRRLDAIVRGVSLPSLVQRPFEIYLSEQRALVLLLNDFEQQLMIEQSRAVPSPEACKGRSEHLIGTYIPRVQVAAAASTSAYEELSQVIKRINPGADRGLRTQLDQFLANVKISQEEVTARATACGNRLRDLPGYGPLGDPPK